MDRDLKSFMKFPVAVHYAFHGTQCHFNTWERHIMRFSERYDLLSAVISRTRGGAQAYVGVLISVWLFLFTIFLFAAQPKEFFLYGLIKLEQRSHKCVELRGICRVNTFFQSRSLLFSL
jgi:hypothetical protein